MPDNTIYAIEISLKEMANKIEDLRWFCNHTHVVAVSTHPKIQTVRLCYLDEKEALNGLHIAKERYETIGEVVLRIDDVPKFMYKKFQKKIEQNDIYSR